jgi:alpha-ketoglutarate-dependent taurine dioxygenase
MTQNLELRPASDALGVEVLDFDAAAPLDEVTTDALRTALDEHQLLLFRDQSLDADAQVEFVTRFGPALIETGSGHKYQYVSNTRADGILGSGRFAFHSDHEFMDEPIDLIALYGVEVAADRGRTHFCNGLRAAATLPTSLRERIGERSARHILDPDGDMDAVVARKDPLADHLPHAMHPILWSHPRLDKPILYVSEQQSDKVESLPDDEGRALLEALFAHLYSPTLLYVHEWREGDLLLWDNLGLQHARDALGSEVPRTLRRVCVGGTPVIEFLRGREDRFGRMTGPDPRLDA